MMMGTAVLIGRVSSFVGLIIAACALWIKLREEEKLLSKHFSTTYAAYKSRTKALIPFIL